MLETLNSGPKKDATQRVQFGNFDIMKDAEGRPVALGKGTFGRTYQACHRYLDTIVALKIINERYAADAGVRQRFLVEARAVARLSHPHIARLYDFGEVDGVLHYAMEYCGGGSLADQVAKHGPLGLPRVLEVGQQIAGALTCAHDAGFIHRDLKPSNIMLTEANGPLFAKLIDFGLVQPSLPEATRSIRDDQSADGARFLGTPLFASPEQLKEEPMDIRTDLFSLGMTLWYLLLGRAPDSGSSAEIAASRLSPESYGTQLPAVLPSQLREVLARLLQKDRKNRFSSAAEVFMAFNACATALGLRRARDYTSVTELTEWENPAPAPVPEQVAKADPTEIEPVEAELASEFKIVTRVNDDFTGSNFVAESKAGGALVFLHVLHPALVEDVSVFELLRMHMTQLRTLEVPEILQLRALRAYSDYVSIVIDKPEGSDLLSILRTERVVHLVDAAPLLESIATVCDRLAAAGLPGPQLAPAHIFVEWPDGAERQKGGTSARKLNEARPKLYPRFLALSEAPELARLNEPEDVSSTMTSDMLGDPSRADNVCEHFGTLLYRIVAGRNCPIAASLSSQAYVAVPGLSEQANRTLSLVIAKQIALASCGQVLREILAAEGIAPRSPGHPSAGFTVPGTGSTVVPPSATPPFPLRTPPKTSTGSTGSSGRFRPMPVAPSAYGAPPPLVVPPSLVVPPPRPIEPATKASVASAPQPETETVNAAGDLLAKVKEPPTAEALKPPAPARETIPESPVTSRESAPKSAAPTSKLPAEGHPPAGFTVPGGGPTVVPAGAPPPQVVAPPLVVPPPRSIEPATKASVASAPPPETETVKAAGDLLTDVKEAATAEALKPPIPARETIPAPPVTTRESAPKSAPPTSKLPAEGHPSAGPAGAPPRLVVPPSRPIEPATDVSTASAPPSEQEPVKAAGDLRLDVSEAPAAPALKALTPAPETSPAPPVTTRESAPPTSRLPSESETKAKVSTPTPPKTSAKKSRQIAAKTQAPDIAAKEDKARTEPVAKAAPLPQEAVTVVSEKIVAPASPVSPPKMTVAPATASPPKATSTAPVIPRPSIIQNVVPWIGRNVRPIGIGIAALLAVSLAYGLVQKIRSRDKAPAASSVTQQQDEPALEPATDTASTTAAAPTAAGPDAEQEKINADRLAERAIEEQKAADEAKATQKAADEAKRLAEQEKVDPPDPSKLAPRPEAAPNVKTPEAPKVSNTQKQATRNPSSRPSGSNRTSQSQSSNRPPQVAPAPRQPPPQRPANNPRPRSRSEFGPTAPGG